MLLHIEHRLLLIIKNFHVEYKVFTLFLVFLQNLSLFHTL